MRVSPARFALVILTVVALGLSSVALGASLRFGNCRHRYASSGDVNRAGDAYSEAYWKLEKTRGRLAKLDKEIAAATAELDAASADCPRVRFRCTGPGESTTSQSCSRQMTSMRCCFAWNTSHAWADRMRT